MLGSLVAPINFYYRSAINWMPLPNWGRFFLELGNTLASYESTQKRVIIGLALPTRSYAASLISLGITIGKFASTDQDREAIRHLQQLSELQNGTPLIYRKNGKLIKVFLDGIEDVHGETRLYLNTKNSKEERYGITAKQALQVEFPSKKFSALSKRSSRRIDVHLPQILSSLLNAEAAAVIVSQSFLDSLTIGSISRLREELQNQSFAVQTESGLVPGVLQDIVRARRFSKDAETYRSEIYHASSKKCENLEQEIPTVVLFDSAAGFLRWRNFWRQSHWVVLFDQTEPEFDVAVQVFNDEYAMSPVSDREIDHFSFPSMPHAPITIYQEVRE